MYKSDSQSYRESWISRGIGILLVLTLGFLWRNRYDLDNERYYRDPIQNAEELLKSSDEFRQMLESLPADEDTVRREDRNDSEEVSSPGEQRKNSASDVPLLPE